jgi:hypothetical protein
LLNKYLYFWNLFTPTVVGALLMQGTHMGFASGGVDVPTWSFVTHTSVRLGLTELRPPTRPNAKPRALCASDRKLAQRITIEKD